MNLDELQSVRDRERQTDKLQQLRASFYEDAGEFIQQLRDQRERAAERADDPFDAPEVNRLSDEIDTAEQTVEAIYEKRVGKIVKAASFAAADLPAESDGMTAEEEELFETLVDDIKTNRQHVMDVLDGVTGGAPTGSASTADTESDRAPPEPSPEKPSAPVSEPDTGPSEDRPTAEGHAAADAATGSPDGPAGEPADERSPPPETPGDGVSAADVMGDPAGASDGEPADGDERADADGTASEQEPRVRNDGGTAAESACVDRETVRITKDVGDFLGVDEREYDLSEDDVVTLPSTNVGPLLDRDAAERL
jgi:DNA replication factor GINS